MTKNGTIKGGEGMITAVVRTIILYLLIILGIRLMGLSLIHISLAI